MGIEPTSEAWEALHKNLETLEPAALSRFDVALNWKMGSAQEFDGACILSRFLKNDKFCFCDRHALRLEQ
jgi:hypothetical protein